MKKALMAAAYFIMAAMMVFLFVGCEEPKTENLELSGDIKVTPNSATIGTELTAYYYGMEIVSYKWKKDNTDIAGNNSYKFTPDETGTYTVTLSSPGYNSKTSDPVIVSAIVIGDGLELSGSIKITPNPATTGLELTAVYDGIEDITYQWIKDLTDEVGENSNKYTPSEPGSYTVTLNSEGYKPKTSSAVEVINEGDKFNLEGDINLSPASAETGTLLTANYTGAEPVTYQWKRNGVNIGANSKNFKADSAGTYTVTVSVIGYNSITSKIASIYRPNGALPIITSNYSADPSVRFFDGRLYLYPSRDMAPATGNDYSRKDRYRVYSTSNMVDWISHGEILRRDDLPAGTGSATNGAWGPHHDDAMFMWAPDAAFKDSKYFYYFSHALGGIDNYEDTWTIGVAQSSTPYGGFKSNVARLKESNGHYIFGDMSFINPCIFQDGSDYYFMSGGNEQFRIARLASSMTELAEPLTVYANMPELENFKEAPWMFKRNGTYYLMYSGNSSGEGGDELLYAISNNIAGPWEYKGIILDPSGTGDTSHGSIVEFNNKWYLFYHNAKLSKGSGTVVNGALRSVCVEELFFNGDGTIQRSIQASTRVDQNGPALNTAELNTKFGAGNYTVQVRYEEGQTYHVDFTLLRTIGASDSSVVVGGGATKQTNDISAGAIHNMHISGSYAEFTQINGDAGGQRAIRFRYARGDGGTSQLQVRVNSGATTNLPVPGTGGWGTVAESEALTINLVSGTNNTIRIGGAGVNIASLAIYGEEK